MHTFSTLLIAVQHVLYLTAANADITDRSAPALAVVRSEESGKQESEQTSQDNATEITVKQVGLDIGVDLRTAKKRFLAQNSNTTDPGSRKHADVYRGHWQYRWDKPKGGEREIVLEWVPPVPVRADKDLPNNITMFPIQ